MFHLTELRVLYMVLFEGFVECHHFPFGEEH